MKSITLAKIITIIEIRGNMGYVQEIKHSQLMGAVAGDCQILVNYVHGQAKRRQKQLTDLGFTLQEIVWRNTDSVTGSYREIWGR